MTYGQPDTEIASGLLCSVTTNNPILNVIALSYLVHANLYHEKYWVIAAFSVLHFSHNLLDLLVMTAIISKVNSKLFSLSSHLNLKIHPIQNTGYHMVHLWYNGVGFHMVLYIWFHISHPPFHLRLTTKPTSYITYLEFHYIFGILSFLINFWKTQEGSATIIAIRVRFY